MRFMKTCTSGKLQHVNEQVSINVRAGNSHRFNNTPLFIHGLASLASRLYNTEECKIAKKRNFFKTKTKKMKIVLFGYLKRGIKGSLEENHDCSVDMDNRSQADV